VGSLYEELYDSFMNVPIPPELNAQARVVYQEELHKKIRILLEKSMRWQRENLLMVERLGVTTDWAAKSKLAYAKLLRLLDPTLPSTLPTLPQVPAGADDALQNGAPSPAPSPAGPPVPKAPLRRGETPEESSPNDGDAIRRHVL
jgi:hypothetical protein